MKKEELTALGMTDEQAEKVLEMHGKEQNEAASKLSEAENKLAAAEKNAKELTEKVKAFDGVDLEALRKSAADWETKYNTDIAKAKLDSINIDEMSALWFVLNVISNKETEAVIAKYAPKPRNEIRVSSNPKK